MNTTALTTLVTLSLAGGCASDSKETSQPDPNTARQQQGVRSADATSRLLALSNASIDAASIGQRANFTDDLLGDVELGIEQYLEGLENPDCLTFDVEEQSETSVAVTLQFDGCLQEATGDEVDGSLEVDVESDDDGVLCDYEGDIDLDGVSIRGEWGIDLADSGAASVQGSVSIVLDGETLGTLIEASWKDVGTECPQLTQHVEVSSDDESTISLDLTGLDLCSGSVCDSDVQVLVEDALGQVEVDVSELDADLDDLDGSLCEYETL